MKKSILLVILISCLISLNVAYASSGERGEPHQTIGDLEEGNIDSYLEGLSDKELDQYYNNSSNKTYNMEAIGKSIAPMSVAVQLTKSYLLISSNKATFTVKINCKKTKIDNVVFNVRLQKKSSSGWSTVKTFKSEKNIVADKATYSATYAVGKGKYRTNSTLTCKKGSKVVETLVINSSVVGN